MQLRKLRKAYSLYKIYFNRAMMMTACDLCGITKPWKIQREVISHYMTDYFFIRNNN